MWSDKGLQRVVNFDAHEKSYVIKVLMEDPTVNHTSNPVRDMVVHAVTNVARSYEIWEVVSTMTEEELLSEFENSTATVQDEIRSVGSLIYNTIGRKQ